MAAGARILLSRSQIRGPSPSLQLSCQRLNCLWRCLVHGLHIAITSIAPVLLTVWLRRLEDSGRSR